MKLAFTRAAAIAALLAAGVASSASPAVAALPQPDPASAVEKTVTLDPHTGAVVSTVAGYTPAARAAMAAASGEQSARAVPPSPQIGSSTSCLSGRACWYASTTPYSNRAFYGAAGSIGGPWDHRRDYITGNYTARGCWRYAGTSPCGTPVGPNTYVSIGVTVTGTSFRIY